MYPYSVIVNELELHVSTWINHAHNIERETQVRVSLHAIYGKFLNMQKLCITVHI